MVRDASLCDAPHHEGGRGRVATAVKRKTANARSSKNPRLGYARSSYARGKLLNDCSIGHEHLEIAPLLTVPVRLCGPFLLAPEESARRTSRSDQAGSRATP